MTSPIQTTALIRSLFPNRWVRWSLISVFWLTLGTISAVVWWYLYFGGQPYTWWVLLRAKLVVWGLWGAVTPLILWLGARYRIEKPVIFRNLIALSFFSVLISAAYIGLYASAVWLNFPPDFPAASRGFLTLIHWIYWNHFSYFYLGYWVVIAIEQMLGFARRSFEREAHSRELERQLTMARLEQLKTQIHPHFLFNTLNAISSLIAESERDRAYEMTSRLSHLLRQGLEHGERQEVTVQEEIAFATEYLELMAMRFPDRLKQHVQVEDGVGRALIPSLILQPLVENAVKFGTGAGTGVTLISLEIHSETKQLMIAISNESSGSQVPDGSTEPNDPSGLGIGLKNTRDRLQQLYGDAHSLTLTRGPAESSTVTLSIPLKFSHE